MTVLIEDENLSAIENIGLTVDRIRRKRLVFYHNLVLSQIIFHSFLIFGQLKISLSTTPELTSTIIAFLALCALFYFPIIMPKTPLTLLKCTAIIYKKREYHIRWLTIFFFYNYW